MILTLILISFLNIVQNKNHEYNKMKKGIEENFTNLNNSSIYHFSIDVDKNDKVEIQLKLNNSFTLNDLNVKYFADTSTKPTSKLEEEGKINLSESKQGSFLILKGSYTVSKSFIYYVSFLVEPIKKNIDIIYVKINKESGSKGFSGTLKLILALSIILVVILICAIATLIHRSRKRKRQLIISQNTIIKDNDIPENDNDNQNVIKTDNLLI